MGQNETASPMRNFNTTLFKAVTRVCQRAPFCSLKDIQAIPRDGGFGLLCALSAREVQRGKEVGRKEHIYPVTAGTELRRPQLRVEARS